MTENLAGRGEGLKGLVAKWRSLIDSARCCKIEAHRLGMGIEEQKHKQVEHLLTKCVDELETALEAAPAGTAPTIESLAAQIDALELTANSIWGIREVRQAIQALKVEVAKLPSSAPVGEQK